MICFEYMRQTRTCNYFDGQKVTIAPMTTYEHKEGGLGIYHGQPTTVGNYQWSGQSEAHVETLTESGWAYLGIHARS